MAARIFQLVGACNNYPWGKHGNESLAARLCSKTDRNFTISSDTPYSELWFGDYHTNPARVLTTGEPLNHVLSENKDTLLGRKVITQLGSQLPFLPKILSIAKALPLQLHPDKRISSLLHSKYPVHFQDPNHKPEIAIALSRFELFAGWKPLSHITELFSLPALRPFVPVTHDPGRPFTEGTLRSLTRNILTAPGEDLRFALSQLKHAPKSLLGESAYIRTLLPRLEEQYSPTDPGILVSLTCLNYFTLSPGEAVFIPANGIHAYLSGDVLECMARSDNVLNAGFCPEEERDDVDIFVNALLIEGQGPGDIKLKVKEKATEGEGARVVRYRPPGVEEFEVWRIELGENAEGEMEGGDGPGIMIVVRGAGKMEAEGKLVDVEEGAIWYVAPGVKVRWVTDEGLDLYMAAA